MLGKRSPQRGMFEADQQYLDFVGEDTFYGFMARYGYELFDDEDFSELYCEDNGRPSVPPSLLAIALLLQAHDGVSDEEAKARADYDMRWKVALGVELDERPFAKSTLQLFRSQLILHEKAQAIFLRSLEYAQEQGYLAGGKSSVALDTTPILGRGAVKDTYNLLADGIKKLIWGLGKRLEGIRPEKWAQKHDFGRYFGSSIKGEAEVDWSDEEARRAFLASIVADADRLLAMARERLNAVPEGSEQEQQIRAAAELLTQLLAQDIEREPAEEDEEDEGPGGPRLKRGVAKDRIVSAHDPEMRHGHKSHSNRFEGHKLSLAVEPESQLITGLEVLAGNAADSEGALELVEQSEANAGLRVEEAVTDKAYGDGATRQTFEDAGRTLIAPVPLYHRRGYFPKEAFDIDLDTMTCTCPAGRTTQKIVGTGQWTDRHGVRHKKQAFQFDAEVCDTCPLREQCTRAQPGRGRTVSLHPQEHLLQEARRLQNSPQFKQYQRMRQAAEHRLARLVQLGVRQARYFGRHKTRFQVLMAAAVANLTLVANETGKMGASLAEHLIHGLLGFPLQALLEPTNAAGRQFRKALSSEHEPPMSIRMPAFRLGF